MGAQDPLNKAKNLAPFAPKCQFRASSRLDSSSNSSKIQINNSFNDIDQASPMTNCNMREGFDVGAQFWVAETEQRRRNAAAMADRQQRMRCGLFGGGELHVEGRVGLFLSNEGRRNRLENCVPLQK
uniref:Uncharacterized protein n=1 Tax=Cucumis melo TaxID=3656 RepID=A0A9I9DR48_CUCME